MYVLFGVFLCSFPLSMLLFVLSLYLEMYIYTISCSFFFPLKIITSLSLPKLIVEYILSILHVNHFDIFHAYKLFWISLSCSFHGWYTEERNLLTLKAIYKGTRSTNLIFRGTCMTLGHASLGCLCVYGVANTLQGNDSWRWGVVEKAVNKHML